MPHPDHRINTHTGKHAATRSSATASGFQPDVASRALLKGLAYFKSRLDWSGAKIARTLHLHTNTVNNWLKHGSIPVSSPSFSPDVQAVVHLLAIHRSLEAMFDDPAHQEAWLSTFHPGMNAVPAEKMSDSIDGLIYVRQYLDYVRGRGA